MSESDPKPLKSPAAVVHRYGEHAEDPTKPMYDRMVDGELYLPKDPQIRDALANAKKWLARLNAPETLALPSEARNSLLAEGLGALGEGSSIWPPFHCDHGKNTHIGKHCFLNYNCCILDVCPVHIGDGTDIGPAVQIYTADHPRDPDVRKGGWEYGRPVRIGRQCWIGGGAIILPGITIGDNAIVGAGAVVTKDVPEDVTVVGNPARPLPKKQ